MIPEEKDITAFCDTLSSLGLTEDEITDMCALLTDITIRVTKAEETIRKVLMALQVQE